MKKIIGVCLLAALSFGVVDYSGAQKAIADSDKQDAIIQAIQTKKNAVITELLAIIQEQAKEIDELSKSKVDEIE